MALINVTANLEDLWNDSEGKSILERLKSAFDFSNSDIDVDDDEVWSTAMEFFSESKENPNVEPNDFYADMVARNVVYQVSNFYENQINGFTDEYVNIDLNENASVDTFPTGTLDFNNKQAYIDFEDFGSNTGHGGTEWKSTFNALNELSSAFYKAIMEDTSFEEILEVPLSYDESMGSDRIYSLATLTGYVSEKIRAILEQDGLKVDSVDCEHCVVSEDNDDYVIAEVEISVQGKEYRYDITSLEDIEEVRDEIKNDLKQIKKVKPK